MMKRVWTSLIALCLTLSLCLTPIATLADGGTGLYALGSEVEDFTVTTFDGETFTLSEALKEKDMVLLNIWASWCGPCGMEFPYLQEAWEAYAADVAVIAVSCEPGDTDDVLRAYAGERGLTFPIAKDTADLALRFNASSIPTSVVIDRFGRAAYIHSGAITSAEEFGRLFDVFVDENYTETKALRTIPPMRPNIPQAELSRLTEAVGGDLALGNPRDAYVWPMIPAEADDRLCLMSSNTGVDGMSAALTASAQLKAGDAIAVTFRVSSEAACDFLRIDLNGETVKRFSGLHDWTTWAIEVPADGEYTLTLSYDKDEEGAAGEDLVYIDEIALLTGDEAAAALAANPAYPVAAETSLALTAPGARQILFDDPTFVMTSMFGLAEYYIVPGETADLRATLAPGLDPEGAYFVTDSGLVSAVSVMDETGYALSLPVQPGYTAAVFVPAQNSYVSEVKTAVIFSSEADVKSLMDLLALYGMSVRGWEYASEEAPAALPAVVRHVLTLHGPEGEPIVGAVANICDADTCTTLVSDAEGRIVFEKAPYDYDVHLIKVPEGYRFDPAQAIEIPLTGGETDIPVAKTE